MEQHIPPEEVEGDILTRVATVAVTFAWDVIRGQPSVHGCDVAE